MSPKQRFLRAFFGCKLDRVPVGNVVSIVTKGLMDATGISYPEAHLDPDKMARLALSGHEILEYDTVMPVFSVVQEAAALGCEVEWGNPLMNPIVKTHPFVEMSEFHVPDDWQQAPSIQVVLQALALLRQLVGDHVVIVGKVMGPWTLSYHMMGAEEFLITTAAEKERALQSLHTLKEVSIWFAKAQMQAGADIICFADHATGGMVSPLAYRDLLLPIHQEITQRIGCPVVLHCCGNTTDRIQYFAETGMDCYHFESQVDVKEALQLTAGKMTLIGNINNPELLLSGSRDQVYQSCISALKAGVHMLSPECAVPLTTPVENLQVLAKATKDFKSA